MKRLERAARVALRTFTQALAAILTGSGAGLLDADWQGALSVSGMAGLIALLMTLSGDDPHIDAASVTKPLPTNSRHSVDTDTETG